MNDPFDRAVERERRERRERKCGGAWSSLLVHFRVYLVVNLLLAAIWALETTFGDEQELWFAEVAWGWGIGLAIHYVVVTQITGRWRPRRRRLG